MSMIDKFIRKKAYAGEPVEALTLADLLKEPEMKQMFAETFVVVNEQATIEEAWRKMAPSERIQDVFITETGSPDEPVIGWLTDRDLADSE